MDIIDYFFEIFTNAMKLKDRDIFINRDYIHIRSETCVTRWKLLFIFLKSLKSDIKVTIRNV